jgi:protein-disulfide isomerase
MFMFSRYAALFVVAAALIVGAIGYLVGVKSSDPEKPEMNAAVEEHTVTVSEILAGETTTPVQGPLSALSESQVAAVQQIVREHLIANPEIIREAIDALQRKEQDAELVAQTEIISEDQERIFASTRQVVVGNPEGAVTLVEFFDYNCGYCKRALVDMQRLVEGDEDLRIVLKEFPVLGEDSVEAARVAIAVNMVAPARYLDFHIALLTEPGHADGPKAMAVAEELGIDMAQVRASILLPEVQATITEVYELANKLSLTGTPSYVTAKEVVVGAVGYDTLKTRIEEARACGADGC